MLKEIKKCTICAPELPYGANPEVQASSNSKIYYWSSTREKVHESGVAWDDPSGNRLRSWLNVTIDEFYDPQLFALVPMGFCYPGKGKSGDNPPRPECAPTWHLALLQAMSNLSLFLLVGSYAQSYYLDDNLILTERVKTFENCPTPFFPLPHPSPRNNIWLKKNTWFEQDVLSALRSKIEHLK